MTTPDYLQPEVPEIAGVPLSKLVVLPTDPAWLRELDKGLRTELDLSAIYASHKGNLREDGGLPLPLLEKLTHTLARDKTLTRLNIARCNLSDPGIDILGTALAENHTLTELDLSVNNLSAKSVHKFRECLERNYSLFVVMVPLLLNLVSSLICCLFFSFVSFLLHICSAPELPQPCPPSLIWLTLSSLKRSLEISTRSRQIVSKHSTWIRFTP